VIERQDAVRVTQLGEGPADAVGVGDGPVGEAEQRADARGRRQIEAPDVERDRNRHRPGFAEGDRDRPRVVARGRALRHEHVHPDGARLPARDVEGERVPRLAVDLVDGGDERVGPAAGDVVGRRRGEVSARRRDGEEVLPVQPDPARRDGARRTGKRRGGGADAGGRAGDDDLEGLELVASCADRRARRQRRGRRVGAELRERPGHTDGPGARTGGERAGGGRQRQRNEDPLPSEPASARGHVHRAVLREAASLACGRTRLPKRMRARSSARRTHVAKLARSKGAMRASIELGAAACCRGWTSPRTAEDGRRRLRPRMGAAAYSAARSPSSLARSGASFSLKSGSHFSGTGASRGTLSCMGFMNEPPRFTP
jgi:hypothetical protein